MPTDKKQEKWIELCAQVAKERDPQKWLALVEEISLLLEAQDSKPSESQAKT